MISKFSTPFLACCALLLLAADGKAQSRSGKPSGKAQETRYLAFQVFTGEANPAAAIGSSGMRPLGPIPTPPDLSRFVKAIKDQIGTIGESRTHLAFIFGPLSFDHTDAQVRSLIASAFSIALEQNVAIGFHLDDSMFWARRKDLWSNPANVEWINWQGTPSTGRRLEWGPQPVRVPPQMCFNSPAIEAEVCARAAVIGRAIQAGRTRLRQQGKTSLFAGLIAGWETQIGQDFDTGRHTGYHALANRGFSRKRPPADPDAEREKVVNEFIRLWSRNLAAAGVPADRLYSHIAFVPRRLFDQSAPHRETYAEHNHFASPAVAFGSGFRPGFSTYPQPGMLEQFAVERNRHGQPAWASSEGTNLQLGGQPGQSGMNMETYLAKLFNHGAALVNVFSFGVGGEANKNMDFRVVTEGEEAIHAYRKFLRGEPLKEAAVASTTYLERLPAKIHRIQKELPVWIQKTGRQAEAEPLMQRLDAALKASNFTEAEQAADAILQLMASK